MFLILSCPSGKSFNMGVFNSTPINSPGTPLGIFTITFPTLFSPRGILVSDLLNSSEPFIASCAKPILLPWKGCITTSNSYFSISVGSKDLHSPL